MTCPELRISSRLSERTDLGRFQRLHPDGRSLILGWLARAWQRRDCEPENSFEPFIFAWISFNGWSACVTELDRDRDWLDAISSSQSVCDSFNALVANVNSPISIYAKEFHALWPIFKAQEIRRSGVPRRDTVNRSEIVEHYFNVRIRRFQPQCWKRHRDEGSEIPIDWPHTLATLYRVRNNLFHGEKSAHSEMDATIVASAFRVLVHFLHNIMH